MWFLCGLCCCEQSPLLASTPPPFLYVWLAVFCRGLIILPDCPLAGHAECCPLSSSSLFLFLRIFTFAPSPPRGWLSRRSGLVFFSPLSFSLRLRCPLPWGFFCARRLPISLFPRPGGGTARRIFFLCFSLLFHYPFGGFLLRFFLQLGLFIGLLAPSFSSLLPPSWVLPRFHPCTLRLGATSGLGSLFSPLICSLSGLLVCPPSSFNSPSSLFIPLGWLGILQ